MARFPDQLCEAMHQDDIFGAMFGTHAAFKKYPHLHPKIAYRSDTAGIVILLYCMPKMNWVAVCSPSREGAVNVQDFWQLPGGGNGPGDMMVLVQEFFKDASHYINARTIPPGRIQEG